MTMFPEHDGGYSVNYCESSKRAAETLSTTTGERKYWERVIAYWDTQLEFARKRVPARSSQ